MALDLTILVGTMTGTAQLVGQELELRLDDGDTRAVAKLMDDLDADVFAGGGLFLVCTSTYGQGDVPDNAKQLYDSLQASLHKRFSMFATASSRWAIALRRDLLQRWKALRCDPWRSGCETHWRVRCMTRAPARCRRKSPRNGSKDGLRCVGSGLRPRLGPR